MERCLGKAVSSLIPVRVSNASTILQFQSTIYTVVGSDTCMYPECGLTHMPSVQIRQQSKPLSLHLEMLHVISRASHSQVWLYPRDGLFGKRVALCNCRICRNHVYWLPLLVSLTTRVCFQASAAICGCIPVAELPSNILSQYLELTA